MEDFSGISLGCRLICGSDDFVQDITGPTIPSQFRPNAIIGNIILRKHSLLGYHCLVHPNVELPLGVAIGSGALIRKKLKYDTEWAIYYYSDNTLQYLGDRNKDKIIQSELEYLQWKEKNKYKCTICKESTDNISYGWDTEELHVCNNCYAKGNRIN